MILPIHERSTEPESDYWRLKLIIDRTFPAGRFIAIYEGQIISDAADLDSLMANILESGIDPNLAIAVQAKADYPKFGVIL